MVRMNFSADLFIQRFPTLQINPFSFESSIPLSQSDWYYFWIFSDSDPAPTTSHLFCARTVSPNRMNWLLFPLLTSLLIRLQAYAITSFYEAFSDDQVRLLRTAFQTLNSDWTRAIRLPKGYKSVGYLDKEHNETKSSWRCPDPSIKCPIRAF